MKSAVTSVFTFVLFLAAFEPAMSFSLAEDSKRLILSPRGVDALEVGLGWVPPHEAPEEVKVYSYRELLRLIDSEDQQINNLGARLSSQRALRGTPEFNSLENQISISRETRAAAIEAKGRLYARAMRNAEQWPSYRQIMLDYQQNVTTTEELLKKNYFIGFQTEESIVREIERLYRDLSQFWNLARHRAHLESLQYVQLSKTKPPEKGDLVIKSKEVFKFGKRESDYENFFRRIVENILATRRGSFNLQGVETPLVVAYEFSESQRSRIFSSVDFMGWSEEVSRSLSFIAGMFGYWDSRLAQNWRADSCLGCSESWRPSLLVAPLVRSLQLVDRVDAIEALREFQGSFVDVLEFDLKADVQQESESYLFIQFLLAGSEVSTDVFVRLLRVNADAWERGFDPPLHITERPWELSDSSKSRRQRAFECSLKRLVVDPSAELFTELVRLSGSLDERLALLRTGARFGIQRPLSWRQLLESIEADFGVRAELLASLAKEEIPALGKLADAFLDSEDLFLRRVSEEISKSFMRGEPSTDGVEASSLMGSVLLKVRKELRIFENYIGLANETARALPGSVKQALEFVAFNSETYFRVSSQPDKIFYHLSTQLFRLESEGDLLEFVSRSSQSARLVLNALRGEFSTLVVLKYESDELRRSQPVIAQDQEEALLSLESELGEVSSFLEASVQDSAEQSAALVSELEALRDELLTLAKDLPLRILNLFEELKI